MELETLGNYMWFSVIYAIVILVYSLYVLYLNKKQADVSKKIDATNILLAKIHDEVLKCQKK